MDGDFGAAGKAEQKQAHPGYFTHRYNIAPSHMYGDSLLMRMLILVLVFILRLPKLILILKLAIITDHTNDSISNFKSSRAPMTVATSSSISAGCICHMSFLIRLSCSGHLVCLEDLSAFSILWNGFAHWLQRWLEMFS